VIEHAGRLLAGRGALVVTVWQPTPALRSSASAGATDSPFDFVEVDCAASDLGERVARDGVRLAQQAGLHAKPVAVEATGPVWKTIVEIVSSGIVHHADRPTLIIRQSIWKTPIQPTERT
jgi:hypothetical protein